MQNNQTFQGLTEFCLASDPVISETALNQAALLLLDTLGIAIGGSSLSAGQIARDFAVDFMAAGSQATNAPLLFDGRTASLPGAAYALATQIDNLDGHDGYNPTKGHIGCAVVPALFAFSEQVANLTGREALIAMVIAYEVAARAGIALHATASDYHTSGAWNALGVAAMGGRLLHTDSELLREALGIAEYHGPRSQMMREIDHPSMLHDGSGMGALVGVKAVLLAQRGFKGAPAITVEGADAQSYWDDLGQLSTIELNYIKPYPICRWAHAALDAVWKLQQTYRFSVEDIQRVEVNTFHEASRLYQKMPQTTSQAQYSLAFALVSLLRFGKIGAEHIHGAALVDPETEKLLDKIHVAESEQYNARFPAGRWSDVTIILKDGSHLESGDTHARGGPEAPFTQQQVIDKFMSFAQPVLGLVRSEAIVDVCLNLTDQAQSFSSLADLVYPSSDSTFTVRKATHHV